MTARRVRLTTAGLASAVLAGGFGLAADAEPTGDAQPAAQCEGAPGKLAGVYYLSWFNDETPWPRVWDPNDEMEEIVEPALGFYTSTYETGRKHAQMLKEIGVDFALIDETNNSNWGPGHPDPALAEDRLYQQTRDVAHGFASVKGGPKVAVMMSITSWDGPETQTERLRTKNYDDADPPYMYYPYIPSNSGTLFMNKVSAIWHDIASNGDSYLHLDGKPVLPMYVAGGATVYDENDVDATPEGKLPDSWNPVVPNTGGKHIRDLFSLRWVGAFLSYLKLPKLIDPSGDGTKAYRGHWTIEDGIPQSWAAVNDGAGDVPEQVNVTPFTRAPLTGRRGGQTYREMWDRAYDVDPTITWVRSWNEFSSTDEPSPEYSQSIEPTKNFYGDEYYNLTRDYIAHQKSYRADLALVDLDAATLQLKNRAGDFDDPGDSFEFGFETEYTVPSGNQVATADFDGNGYADLAVRDPQSGDVTIRYSPYFAADSVKGHRGETVVELPTGDDLKLVAGDLAGDGNDDLGLASTVSNELVVTPGDGCGSFGRPSQRSLLKPVFDDVVTGDVDADGRSELVTREASTGKVTVLPLSDTRPREVSGEWAAGEEFQLVVGDYTGDGRADVGLRNTETGTVEINVSAVPSRDEWRFSGTRSYTWKAGSGLLPLAGDWR